MPGTSARPPPAAAITAAFTALRHIEQPANDWTEHGHPSERLWERGQLAAARTDTDARLLGRHQPHRRPRLGYRLPVTDRVELGPRARAFLQASIRRDRFRRGRSIAILSALLVLALIAAGVASI